MTVYATYNRGGVSYPQYGRDGSTLMDEFNRLANGGEYPSYKNYLGMSAAINKWKGYPAGTGILAALNKAAGSATSPSGFLDFVQVINYYLESTLGPVTMSDPALQPPKLLSAVQALRLIAS